jgi:hypothetical protein
MIFMTKQYIININKFFSRILPYGICHVVRRKSTDILVVRVAFILRAEDQIKLETSMKQVVSIL